MTRLRIPLVEAALVIGLFGVSFLTSYQAMRTFRAKGIQPSFYQGNFEPAVMMACGRGFVAATTDTVPVPLVEFLQLKRNTFDCSLLPASLPRTQVTWNAPWYDSYGTTAMFWRVSGISWTALDVLVSLMGGVVALALYGLFRLVTGTWVAAAATMVLTVSPANLTHLLSLRDYSKAPFVLLAVLILAVLVTEPMRMMSTLMLVGVYGALVGFGWGFRSDLTVMVPFGVFVVLVLLPGPLRANAARNGLAALILLSVFLVVAWPALRGLKMGGCQFHYALLGLTTPLTNDLGMTPALYSFGGHFLDTFVDLKVGDYAHRVLDLPLPNLCSPDYDIASGGLFWQMATTFPADLAAHAYGSVLMIGRAGLAVPAMTFPAPPFPSSALAARAYRLLGESTALVAPAGPMLILAAIAAAWAHSVRLGVALTVFALFLMGYPAIEFEERHWFHLRFIPWWAAMMVGRQIVHLGVRGWTRPAVRRAAAGVAGLLFALVVALAGLRGLQARTVRSLIAQYEAARTEDVPIEPSGGSFLPVRWQPRDYAQPPAHRGSDLLVVTLDPARCAGTEELILRVKYEADLASHDISTEISMARPNVDAGPMKVFVPVYWQGFQDLTYMRFSGFEMAGAQAACIARVARVVDGASLPLWVEMQVPATWSSQRLYQGIRTPRLLRWVTSRLLL